MTNSKKPIFISDNTISERVANPDDEIIQRLLKFQLGRDEKYKIYLPPTVFMKYHSATKDEQRAQINNLFGCVLTLEPGINIGIAPEICLTGDMLKPLGSIESSRQLILVTDDPRLHEPQNVLVLKQFGFSAVIAFERLGIILDEDYAED